MTLQQLKYVIEIADSGSVNAASKNLYVSQPSLSGAVKSLEEEIGFELFRRSNRGVTVTAEGEEFLNYARQVCAQYALLEERFVAGKTKKKFSVSAQHYTFAVNAFSQLIRRVGMETYEFSMLETKTYECIENVRDYKSELGILYQDDFNQRYISRLLEEKQRAQDEQIASERRSQVGTGDRSERIRTYNYPQGRVTDHRIGLTLYRLEEVLNGDLDEIIDALITYDQTEKLKASSEE